MLEVLSIQFRYIYSLPDIPDFSEALPHDVDVVNIEEDEFHVFVGVLVLVAAPGRNVGHRVHLRSRVHDEDPMRLCVRIHDLKTGKGKFNSAHQ